MSLSKSKSNTGDQLLDSLIEKALKKIGSDRENDICRYLPVDGGYMHHFTLRKMKHEVPEELSGMIEKFIITTDDPERVPPKPRAARGSRKNGDQPNLNRDDLKRLLNIARLANDQEMIRKLTPQRSLPSVKRDLMRSIRQGKVDHDLWSRYVEVAEAPGIDFDDAELETAGSSVSWKDLPGM